MSIERDEGTVFAQVGREDVVAQRRVMVFSVIFKNRAVRVCGGASNICIDIDIC